MDKIETTVKEFKRNNGNNKVDQRDLVIYIVSQVDKIDGKINEMNIAYNDHMLKSCSLITRLRTTTYYTVTAITVLFGITAYLIRLRITS